MKLAPSQTIFGLLLNGMILLHSFSLRNLRINEQNSIRSILEMLKNGTVVSQKYFSRLSKHYTRCGGGDGNLSRAQIYQRMCYKFLVDLNYLEPIFQQLFRLKPVFILIQKMRKNVE